MISSTARLRRRNMTRLEDEVVDVVVIGSGPSGAVVTHTLAAQGFKVVCLEQGDWVSPADYPANYPEWELLIQKQWAHDPNERRLPADYPLEVSGSDRAPARSAIYKGGPLLGLTGDRVFAGH